MDLNLDKTVVVESMPHISGARVKLTQPESNYLSHTLTGKLNIFSDSSTRKVPGINQLYFVHVQSVGMVNIQSEGGMSCEIQNPPLLYMRMNIPPESFQGSVECHAIDLFALPGAIQTYTQFFLSSPSSTENHGQLIFANPVERRDLLLSTLDALLSQYRMNTVRGIIPAEKTFYEGGGYEPPVTTFLKNDRVNENISGYVNIHHPFEIPPMRLS